MSQLKSAVWGGFFGSICSLIGCLSAHSTAASHLEWPQFLGPRGTGRALSDKLPPAEFGPERNVEWKAPVPRGHSSPIVSGDFIFLTGVDAEKRTLSLICIDRTSGRTRWERERKVEKLEPCHNVSNAATATPATDGQRVFTYFSSYGLSAHDFDGKELWTRPMPVAVNRMGFGSGTSPIVVSGLVLLDVHAGADSHMLALRAQDGEVAWKSVNPLFNDGWSTPVVWQEDGEDIVGVLNASRFIARRLKDGSEKWWLAGMPNQTCATPAVGNGWIGLTGTGVLGESSEILRPPSFSELVEKYDVNKDGMIATEELPNSLLVVDRKAAGGAGNMPLRQLLGFRTGGKNVTYDREAWEKTLSGMSEFLNGDLMTTRVMAVRVGGSGDVSKSAVIWNETKGVPEISSPLLVSDRIYFVKSGGTVLCRDARTGKTLYEERLGAPGGYYASPVESGGRIFAASDRGTVVVFEGSETLHVLARNDLGEAIFGTPALVDGKVYVRGEKNLFAFGR